MSAHPRSAIFPSSVQAASASRDRLLIRKTGRDWPPSLRSHTIGLSRDDDLLAVVSAGPRDRVLVIGEAAADTLCDAMRRGCRGGSAFRAAPAHPEPVEIVVAPTIRTQEAGQAVVACARRALPAGGRLVLRAVGQGAAEMARGIADRLRTYGFERVRLRGQAEGALILCRLSGGSTITKVR